MTWTLIIIWITWFVEIRWILLINKMKSQNSFSMWKLWMRTIKFHYSYQSQVHCFSFFCIVTFGSVVFTKNCFQGVLLPKDFDEFMPERNICISMAASVRDVCQKNPDRGVDLILSVSVWLYRNCFLCTLLCDCYSKGSLFCLGFAGLHWEPRPCNSISWLTRSCSSLWSWCNW